jgi:diacylglycerol kinase
MDMELHDKNKQRGLTRLKNSFKYSFSGLKYAYSKEQNMAIHLLVTILVIVAGVFFKISYVEWFFVIIIIGLVLATELINTAIEATIDLVSPKIHPLAKIAKDTASAAVFIFALVASIGGLLIFVPKIIERFF